MTAMAETSYLKDLVGEALAQGCAVTVAQAPTDPVEFLGHWLLRYGGGAEKESKNHNQCAHDEQYVESSSIERQFRAERQLKEQAAAEVAAVAKTAAEAEADRASARQKAVAAIAEMDADPLQVWSAAVNAVVAHTDAASAYVANVVEPEEPDFQWPELEEGEEEPLETDDEGGDAPPADPEGEVEGEAAPAEEEAAEPEAEAGEEQKPTLKQKPDYSKCLFQYAAAAPKHQAFLVEDHLELRRPPPPTEEEAEDEAYKPAPTPPTFLVLDREQPSLYLRNAAYHQNVTFLAGFPRIGAYFAAASSDASGRYQSLLCADTLMPNGTGEMLGQEDRDFIWDVAKAVGQALAKATQARQSAVPEAHAAEEELLQAVQDIYQPAQAAAEDEAGDAAAAPPADAVEPDAADAPEEGGDAEAEVDDITRLTKEIAALAASIDAAQEGANTTQAQLDVEQQVLAVMAEKLKELSAAALQEMNSYRCSPPATFHIAKAVMWLLGRKREEFDTWKKLLAAWNCAGLLEELTGYDATQERDLARWKEIRACYKAVPKKDPLFEELPTTGYGVFLLMFVKQVRKVARKAAKLRTFQATLQVQTETKSKKDEELDAAQKAKEAAEAEAAAAAEAEAAAAAAAAEQGGEGGGDEGEAAADTE